MGAGETEMTGNPSVQTLITYGSRYGSAEHYARKFAECTGFLVLPYREAKKGDSYDRIIHFGALYAGGVLGLRQILQLLSAETALVVVTVGLADVRDAENIRNIRSCIHRRLVSGVKLLPQTDGL